MLPGASVRSFLCRIELPGNNRHRVLRALAHVGFRLAADQQAEQFRANVVAARIRQPLPRAGLLEPNISGCFATYSRILVAGLPMIASKSWVSRSYRLSAWSWAIVFM